MGTHAGGKSRRGGFDGPSIVLVDDHPLWRESLKRLLERKRVGRLVAEASDGDEALGCVRRHRPDLVIMDIDLPRLDGIEATRLLQREAPDLRVLFLSALDDEDDVVAAIRAGASGYLLKTAAPDEVVDAIRRVHTGELVFPPSLAPIVREQLLRPSENGSSPKRRSKREHRAAGPAFLREGEYWTVSFGDETSRLKDSKGVRYISVLLRSPGEGFHCLELVAAIEGVDARRASHADAAEAGLAPARGSSEPILDPTARAAYRTRLQELMEQAEEAESWNDSARKALAREEIDALTREFARATGLGGRARQASSESERARVNVARAISSALQRIRSAHPALGAHLRAAIKTGTFCTYEPQEPVRWRL